MRTNGWSDRLNAKLGLALVQSFDAGQVVGNCRRIPAPKGVETNSLYGVHQEPICNVSSHGIPALDVPEVAQGALERGQQVVSISSLFETNGIVVPL